MENEFCIRNSSFGGGARLSSVSERYADASMIGSTRYSALERGYSSHHDGLRFPSSVIPGVGAAAGNFSGVDGFGTAPAAVSGMKRPAEALYHQTIPGTQNVGQAEALFSTNSLVKHARLDSANHLHNYPLRPGVKECAYYMRTKTCNFGVNCKFDHPLWVPEGGIPEWKEIAINHESESLPEKPGEPDCPYFMKTQRCKFGPQCKFNHPKGKLDEPLSVVGGEDVQVSQAGQKAGSAQLTVSAVKDYGTSEDSKQAKTFVPFTPALLHNSKGLPIRLGETSCPFYLKTGSCKYGATCRYNHPALNTINQQVPVALGQAVIPPLATSLPFGVLHTAANILPNIDLHVTQTQVAVNPTIYPQRPGQLECDFFMKTGQCKFGERCKFHHPIVRSAPVSQEPTVKLTLAGLPRREGAATCSYYMKTGACKYGANCRFDHPPPGEAIAMATGQGQGSTAGNGTGAFATPGEEDAAGAAEQQQ